MTRLQLARMVEELDQLCDFLGGPEPTLDLAILSMARDVVAAIAAEDSNWTEPAS